MKCARPGGWRASGARPTEASLRGVVLRSVIIGALLLAAVAGPVGAHPGRLDAEGCHTVRTRWVSRDGKVVEPGERHCHRKLGQGFGLDGREVLQDEPEAPAPWRVRGEEIQSP